MNGVSRIISKYDDIASYEFNSMNLGPLSKINDYPNKNFYGGVDIIPECCKKIRYFIEVEKPMHHWDNGSPVSHLNQL